MKIIVKHLYQSCNSYNHVKKADLVHITNDKLLKFDYNGKNLRKLTNEMNHDILFDICYLTRGVGVCGHSN